MERTHRLSTSGKASMIKEEEPSRHATAIPSSSEAHARVDTFLSESKLRSLSSDNAASSEFSKAEIVVGDYLGKGSYSIVEEIIKIQLNEQQEQKQQGNRSSSDCRTFLSQHCHRDNGDTRYAIKQLQEEILNDPKRCSAAMADLVLEAQFLKKLQHPHIIKLRGVGSGDPYSRNYFLVLDKLYCTLSHRLKEWKVEGQKQQAWWRRSFHKQDDVLWLDRLTAGYHLSAALQYLHDRQVVHRDIKPENIGFDIRDDIKLFDFGLARELLPSDAVGDGTWNLTRSTGTIRYMAPEVFDRPYNCRADVYSFGVLFWYILALKKPYQKQEKEFMAQVVLGGARPKIKRKWPKSIRFVLEQSWKHNPAERIEMGQIKTILSDAIYNTGNDSSDVLNTSRRRSTYVFVRERASGRSSTKSGQRLATAIDQTQSSMTSV